MKKTVLAVTFGVAMLQSAPVSAFQFQQQQQLAQFATGTELHFAVVNNFLPTSGYQGQLTLVNRSELALAPGQGNWQIYLHSVRLLATTEQAGLKLEHVQGDLHRLTPTKQFAGLAKGAELVFNYKGASAAVSYSDFMPRAFIVAGKLQAEVFRNTDTEQLQNFVKPLEKPEQLLRYQTPEPDLFPIATSATRYQNNQFNQRPPAAEQLQDLIIPTPKQVNYHRGRTELNTEWTLVYQGRLTSEASYLKDQLKLHGLELNTAAAADAGKLQLHLKVDPALKTPEQYQLSIQADRIIISGADNAGVFYGVQSLLSVVPAPSQVSTTTPVRISLPRLTVDDQPRFSWRGMHYDMGRNFHGKEVTLRLIEQMSRYKLNKLHLHLTEDEGWRLEIPGLPELTEIGAHRCFDLTEQQCLLTQLGTGPHKSGSGNGYYSREDFIEILKFAKARHIEVIPEIDMPGHARAAVKAMEARYNRLKQQGDEAGAKQFLLSDPADTSKYLTVQLYTDNSVNVCLDSTYAFIDKVVYELQQMYRQAGLKLNTYHMGGDEVGAGSWTGSPACQALFAKGIPAVAGVADLKPYFVSRVSSLLTSRDLALAGWEDGLMYDPLNPFNRSQFDNKNVIANVWDNIWEWGFGDRAYRLANQGYQVVLSHGTHLYFDHPHEAHPAERGYYWATRFTDAKRVFSYLPDYLYANADKTRSGAVIKDLEALVGRALPALEKPENILGMQGQVWSETIRTAAQLEEMVYPRLLPLAERAWHKANWEAEQPDIAARDTQWQQFVTLMSKRELPKLAHAGVQFYLPPPGAIIEQGKLLANVAYPSLAIEYSLDQGQTWLQYPAQGVQVNVATLNGSKVWLRTKGFDGRYSRITYTD